MGETHWYKRAIIYELHVKCFFDSSGDGYGDFQGLTEKLDYLQDLGVTAIWLLPFYPSPLKDDGYDIANYTDVHPQYGNLGDFKHFLSEAHRRGLKVITELVINHTSDQHPWFQRARKAPPGSPERDFYVWSESEEKYRETRIIFQDYERSNWTWDPEAKAYYWHRFYSHQPDLNFDNPAVHEALFEKLSFWLDMGVDGVRLDAIPYLYEREGTTCENLPETHAFLKKLRAYVDEHYSDRMLLAEANQWPEEAAEYFGAGDECHMAFHFPVMPRLFMSIHLEDSLPIIEIMGQTPEIPESCQWALFLRNHDELTLEMVTDEERDYMWRVYAHDPKARVNLGIRRRLAPLLKNDRRKIELINTLLFSLTGTPVLYYGDEIGMGDNIYLGDRDGVRTPMQWSADRNAGFSRTNPQALYLPPIIDPEYHFETVNVEAQSGNPHSLLWWTKQLISLRKRHAAFSEGTTTFLPVKNRKVLVFFREREDELILIIANLSRFPQYVELDLQQYNGYNLVEMFSGQSFPPIGELPYFLTLGAYGYYWFSLTKEREKYAPELALPLTLLPQKRELTDVVRRYLFASSWFRPYLLHLDRTHLQIVDHLQFPHSTLHLLMVEFALTSRIVHKVPLYLEEKEGELVTADEALIEQVVPGKRFHLLDEGLPLDIEMRLYLSDETQFRAFFPLLGYTPYHTSALAMQLDAPDEPNNGFALAVEAADRFLTNIDYLFEDRLLPKKSVLELAAETIDEQVHAIIEEHIEVARQLGEMTAHFHQALAGGETTPFTLFYQRSIYQTMRRKVSESGFLEKERLDRVMRHLLEGKIVATRTRHHGDFVLDKLHYTGKEFVIATFEGQEDKTYAEKRYMRSPLIDCASILFSFAEASFAAAARLKERGVDKERLDDWALVWAVWVGSSFIRSYWRVVENLPEQSDYLLGLFVLEKCIEKWDTPAAKALLDHWLPIYEK